MSDKFGLMSLARVDGKYLEGQAYLDCSQQTAAEVDLEVQRLLEEAFAEAKQLLESNRTLLVEISEYLLTKETITGDELMAYVNADQQKKESDTEQTAE